MATNTKHVHQSIKMFIGLTTNLANANIGFQTLELSSLCPDSNAERTKKERTSKSKKVEKGSKIRKIWKKRKTKKESEKEKNFEKKREKSKE